MPNALRPIVQVIIIKLPLFQVETTNSYLTNDYVLKICSVKCYVKSLLRLFIQMEVRQYKAYFHHESMVCAAQEYPTRERRSYTCRTTTTLERQCQCADGWRANKSLRSCQMLPDKLCK
jgi:hypothetical protein